MDKVLVDRFMSKKGEIEAKFTAAHPDCYEDVVRAVVEAVTSDDEYGEKALDPNRIHAIDDGDYQGTLLYVIGAKGYQPSDYWCVAVDYGSCSGCDTLEGIRGYRDEAPRPDQVKDYMTLALHIVQGLRHIAGYSISDPA